MTHRFILVAIAWLLPALAFAGSTDEAREHYEKATAHFAVGEFADAAVEYQAAYKAKQDPALLYDAAQAYRLANNPDKALILYRNYLQLYPSEANIAEVRAQIEKLKDAIAAADKAKTAPPTGTNEPTRIRPEATHPNLQRLRRRNRRILPQSRPPPARPRQPSKPSTEADRLRSTRSGGFGRR